MNLLKFYFQQTLNKDFPILHFVRPAPEKKLPVILSQQEVRKILASIRLPLKEAEYKKRKRLGLMNQAYLLSEEKASACQ